MLTPRRSLLAIAGAPVAARAQETWPSRPIRIILPAPGGGGTADTLARIVAQALETRLGQRVLVENRGGANGNIGAAAAARAAPDGHTFLWSWAGTLATNPALYREPGFDPLRDFDPVVLIGNVPNILVVARSLPITTLAEFAAYARAEPGRVNYASSGNGSSMHMAGALFALETRRRNGACALRSARRRHDGFDRRTGASHVQLGDRHGRADSGR